jgi:hypothetical protein
MEHEDIVGSFFGKLGKKIGKIGKAVLKSPLLKVAATGLSFIVPAVGVPLLAATALANKLVSATKDVKQAATALNVIKRTQTLARAGDVGSQRAVKLLAHAARSQAAVRAPVARQLPRAAPRAAPRAPVAIMPARRVPPPAAPLARARVVAQPAAAPAAKPSPGWLVTPGGRIVPGLWRRT